MGDPVTPGDYGAWIRGRDVANSGFDPFAIAVASFTSGTATRFAAIVSDIAAGGTGGGTAIAIVSPTTTVSSGVATWSAVLVRDPAGGGAGGVSTVTADQGVSGTQAWPVAQSGPVVVSAITMPALSVSAIASVLASVSAIPSVLVSASALPAISVSAIAAVSVSANVSQLVSVSAIPSILASVSAIPSILASISAIPVVSASQSGAWTANVSVSGNVSQLVSVSAIPSVLASISAIPSVLASISALPVVSASQSGVWTARVYQETNALASTIGFTVAASGTTSLIAAPGANISLALLHVQIQNGDSIIHRFPLLQSVTGSTLLPAYGAANGGGFVAEFIRPFRAIGNAGISISLDANCGTRSVEGVIQYVTVS